MFFLRILIMSASQTISALFLYSLLAFSNIGSATSDDDTNLEFSNVFGIDTLVDDNCPVMKQCEALHRLVVSCDATSTATGCGTCLDGYSPAREMDQRACVKSSSSTSVAASLGFNEDKLVDELTSNRARNAEQDSSDSASSDAGLSLSARADTPGIGGGGGNGTAGSRPDDLPIPRHPGNGDFVFYVIVGTTTGIGLLIIIICAVCWFKYNAANKQADDEFVDSDFAPQQQKVSGGHPGDGKLALSAQMYHYQHQKQQMMALEKSNNHSRQGASDVDSDLENEDADFTVYECPGLAPTGEMEVRNPLFKEELDHNQQPETPK